MQILHKLPQKATLRGSKEWKNGNKEWKGNGQVYFLIWHPCPITA
jgi:hypothetical protein